ncbi:preprotein translocase subunit SecA [Patescibacteria group bacterium]|nr:preprotein translocase subunit SecA [Patescibacteria group bacterium]MBU1703200.1 preprotein translocase subunit SecA [Patescibacteria group bacterium]MBU1953516.1 preprotein translocase subunit SecA [Patescibacteria group bacterium]
MIYKLINKILGDPNEKALKQIWPIVHKINEIALQYDKALTENDITAKTEEFKKRLENGETLDDLLPEAFALVKFACKKLLGKKWDVRGHDTPWEMIPFDVQILGGIVQHQGKITEMKTGEGKTLVCTMPAYLNALTGKGVHIVTVNDYLAHRDSEWMGGLFRCLGLTVGVITHGQDSVQKKEAYACDITYGTNNEFGFDYLRDNMTAAMDNLVQRELVYAIVDEVDSILIDEARTPLIISAPAEESTSKYMRYAHLISDLKEHEDYEIDEKMKTATLTEEGIARMEKKLGVENIYTDAGFLEVHHLEQALKAKTVYLRDIDYMVKDDEILIVDEFTGRLMEGRRYSDGLHQAIEAKENVEIKRESRTLATITFQNYFRIYKKLAGMTGTAMTEAEEFLQIYGLDPIEIPTNKPVCRDDKPDMVFKNQKGKYMAVTKRVQEAYEKGQPVLIGTISIEKSEIMSRMLELEKIPHNVLNAKHHEREAEIVAQAGQMKAITIATNMAGRGTDIKLGPGVEKIGGLLVIGTERHESRRIDNQLRGRSGRQGDHGESQFFVSMEDDLMRLFGAEKIQNMMERMNVPDDMPIQNKMISGTIESAQKKVEGRNFDIRKHIVQYDDVMNKHREIMYSKRRKLLENESVKNDIILLIENETEALVGAHSPAPGNEQVWQYDKILEDVHALHQSEDNPLKIEDLHKRTNREDLIEKIKMYYFTEYESKEKVLTDPEIMRRIEKNVYLNIIDTLWMEHIDNMTHLRESVALKGYAQRDPLIEYKEQAYLMLQQLLASIQHGTVTTLFKLNLQQHLPERLLRSTMPRNMITNDAQISSVTEGSSPLASSLPDSDVDEGPARNPVIIRAGGAAADSAVSGSEVVGGTKKIHAGRNDPCPCGSGKKYKKCHGIA